jgi:hypothetical protein
MDTPSLSDISVGTFYRDPSGSVKNRPIYGARIASKSFTEALFRHGKINCCHVITPKEHLDSTALRIEELKREGRAQIPVINVTEQGRLFEGDIQPPVSVWHEPGAT